MMDLFSKVKKLPAPSWPNYQGDYIKNLPEGTAYHTITYGKGLMGSHAFMLNPEERWKVIKYVKLLAYGDAFQYTSGNSTTDTLAVIPAVISEEIVTNN